MDRPPASHAAAAGGGGSAPPPPPPPTPLPQGEGEYSSLGRMDRPPASDAAVADGTAGLQSKPPRPKGPRRDLQAWGYERRRRAAPNASTGAASKARVAGSGAPTDAEPEGNAVNEL